MVMYNNWEIQKTLDHNGNIYYLAKKLNMECQNFDLVKLKKQIDAKEKYYVVRKNLYKGHKK